MSFAFSKSQIALAALAVIGATTMTTAPTAATAAGKTPGKYVSGDIHNHTTCSDGTLSLKKLVNKSVDTFGLDWFVQAGHGGGSSRNCTISEDPFEPVAPALGLTSICNPASNGVTVNLTVSTDAPGESFSTTLSPGSCLNPAAPGVPAFVSRATVINAAPLGLLCPSGGDGSTGPQPLAPPLSTVVRQACR